MNNNKSLLIKKLLSKKHTKDFFMCEVKTGKSWGASYGIVDAFAMKKSWVKVLDSDNDFLYNNKKELIKEYLKDKMDSQTLSWRFKSKLVKKLAKAEETAKSYKQDHEKFKEIIKICEDLGISTWYIVDNIRDILKGKAEIGNKMSI